MEKKKILFFHFDLGDGGAERVLVNLLNNLDENKYDITLRTIFSGGVNRNNLKSHINFKPLFNRKAFRGMRLIFKMIPAIILNKLLIKGTYDIQIAYLEGIPTRIIGAIKKNEYTKKFAWVHVSPSSKADFLRCYRSDEEFNEIYNNFNKIAFVSNKALADFENFYSIDVEKEVVHNINDYEKIKKLSQEDIDISLSKSRINFCSIGRLNKQKRFDRLIDSLANLYNRGFADWHIYILGKGELEDSLKTQVEQLGLEQNVTFLGFQKNPYKYISRMDLVICSSEREGFSTAVTEAIFLGIPVLTTDCAGMEEIIENNKTGFIVENSTQGLIKGLDNYLNLSKELKQLLITNTREAANNFSLSSAKAEFERFLEI